ncbi:hypothetical protein ACHQM5_004843 [Ranunculus cassubicifolius]
MELKHLCESINKENIPPFCFTQTTPTPSIITKNKRLRKPKRTRKPLQDITNLFNQPIQSNLPVSEEILLVVSNNLVSSSNSRKRRAIGDDDNDVDLFKRSQLRKNFR